jgi:hypothetical protein
MEDITLEQIQDARDLIFPEAMVTMTAEDYTKKVICAEHQQSLHARLERATWEAYCRRHGIAEQPMTVMNRSEVMRERARGFG